MDSSIEKNLAKLRLYLNTFPNNLFLPTAGKSMYKFDQFALDSEWLEDLGEEGAVNRELEV
jgi:hypothetical protein